MTAELDHLVIAAPSLDAGVLWCERTLGVTPGPGGRHPLMGTHNRLLALAGEAFPRAYLEIIAIDPEGHPPQPPLRQRWFDLDQPTLMQHVQQHGPTLVHWVARVPDALATLAAWQALGLNGGTLHAASRPTPQGELRWHIALTPDGHRPWDGCAPTLIQWGEHHPTDTLPANPVRLLALNAQHPHTTHVQAAWAAMGWHGSTLTTGPAALCATLSTPRGNVVLTTPAFTKRP